MVNARALPAADKDAQDPSALFSRLIFYVEGLGVLVFTQPRVTKIAYGD